MIALFALAAAATAELPVAPKRYEVCGQSAASVEALTDDVKKSRSFTPVPNSGDWSAFSNDKDTVWLFPAKPTKTIHVAVCRHLVSNAESTSMETRLLCDGPDADCNAIRDQLLGPSAGGGRTKQ